MHTHLGKKSEFGIKAIKHISNIMPGSGLSEEGFGELKDLYSPKCSSMRPKLANAYMVGTSLLRLKRKVSKLEADKKFRRSLKRMKLE